MKQINTINYVYNPQGEVAQAIVQYTDGTQEVVSSKGKILEVQNQLKFQSKQILMENGQ
jgi:regulator of sigma D